MTKKDYIKIIDTLKSVGTFTGSADVIQNDVWNALAGIFQDDNPNFNMEKFFDRVYPVEMKSFSNK